MPRTLTALQVFIASPGGLADERKAFRDVIERVNHDSAHDSGITFVPRGWEYASAGVGRPQEKINEQVRASDYLVVILWDKWGRPTGSGGYTSGTEEEYRVGLECLRDGSLPMVDIVVLFKGVNERQLADPGADLKQVLAFKSELERSRDLLYSTFDTLDEFRDDFRTHLHKWIRDWQGEEPPGKNSPVKDASPGSVDDEAPSDAAGLTLAQQAKAAVDRGRYTVAEQIFAVATTGVYDREAYTEYVRFLRKRGRLSLAQTATETFLSLAQDADDHVGEVEALANLAILERQEGRNLASLDYLQRALEVVEELIASLHAEDEEARQSALSTKAFLLDNKSLTLRRIPGRIEDALDALVQARAVHSDAGDQKGAGFTLKNQGSLLMRLGRLAEAEAALMDALGTFEQVGYANGQAATLASLGEVYESMGDTDRAIEVLERSIAVSPNRTLSRIVANYGILARLHIKKGNLEEARNFADHCLRAAQDLGTPESQATALHADAMIALATGDADRAVPELQDALQLFQQVDNRVGVAAVQISLARHYVSIGMNDMAQASLDSAVELLDRAPHFGLSRDIAEVREVLHDVP